LIRLRRPSSREIESLLDSAAPLSYPEVGATAELDAPGVQATLRSRYALDRRRFALGRGRALFERAVSALLAWRHFEIPWLELHGARPVQSGQVVATLTSVTGLWFANPCRVVYVDSAPAGDSAAFAYGTLHGHVMSGEERFTVSFDPATGEVRYEIAAFSRPAVALVRLGHPIARRIQRRFAADSARALTRAAAR
jgi:uncharacterized protein (UPF0548 family)